MAPSSIILGLTALVFCTWSVSLAGIASIQDSCDSTWQETWSSVNGFSAGLPCMKLFRYYWFIVCLEVALIAGLGASLATGLFSKTRLSWMGLFCVATLLYIQMTDAFLTAQSFSEDSNAGSALKHRVRTMIAGSIMTATVNCFLIIALGTNPVESASPAKTDV